ncbi:YveK family protein [Clostridium hydrogenum]|uniref:YveK family protein n=1 Tax=Clostridium hydrogenum TaxID=2855764 RepID=UPI001F3303F4|nr:Wzz/FepE/Etk N-terminal domain-containing protein [Clostridium hydrogenum]
MEEQEMTLDLKDFFYIISKRKKMICLITAAAIIITGLLSFFVIKPTYQANTSIIVGRPQQDKSEKLDNNDVTLYQNLMKTYIEIVTSKPVLDATISEANVNYTEGQLSKMINASSQQGTQIMDISITGKNAEETYKIANALTESFIDKSKDIFPTSGVQLSVMNKAEVPKSPIKPKKALNVAIAFILGLFVSIGLAFVLEYMDNTIKSENDVNKYLELPVIGIIPDQPDMQE